MTEGTQREMPEWGSSPSTRDWEGPGKGIKVKVTVTQAIANAEALGAEAEGSGRYPRVGVRPEEAIRFQEKFGPKATVTKPVGDQEMLCVARHNASLARQGKTGPLSGIRSGDQLHALESFVSEAMRSVRGGFRTEVDRPFTRKEFKNLRWRVPVLARMQLGYFYRENKGGAEADLRQIDQMVQQASGEYTWPRSQAQYEALVRLLKRDPKGPHMWLRDIDLLRQAGIDNRTKLVDATIEFRRLCQEPPIERDFLKRVRRLAAILAVGRNLRTNKPLTAKERQKYQSEHDELLEAYTAWQLKQLKSTGIPVARIRREITKTASPTPMDVLPLQWHPYWDVPEPKKRDFPSVEYLEELGRDNWRLLVEGADFRLHGPEERERIRSAYEEQLKSKKPTGKWDWWNQSRNMGVNAHHIIRAAAWDERDKALGPMPKFTRSQLRTAENRFVLLSEPFELRPGLEARYYLAPEEEDSVMKTTYYGLGILFRTPDDEWRLESGYRFPYEKLQRHGAPLIAHRDQLARMSGPPGRRQRNLGQLRRSLMS